jgi:hypothetical protein
MNTLTLMQRLTKDLAHDDVEPEPLLNGRGKGALTHGTVPLDSYVTRLDLAVAAVAFLETNPRNATSLTELDVAELLDRISTDDNPRLDTHFVASLGMSFYFPNMKPRLYNF